MPAGASIAARRSRGIRQPVMTVAGRGGDIAGVAACKRSAVSRFAPFSPWSKGAGEGEGDGPPYRGHQAALRFDVFQVHLVNWTKQVSRLVEK